MYMVASWACEVAEILTQRNSEEASFVKIRVTSQAQLAATYQIQTGLFLLYMTLL